MSHTVSYGCWQFLTFSHFPWSCYISLTFSSSSMELLHVHHCVPLLLAFSHFLSQSHWVTSLLSLSSMITAFSHCLSGPMEFLHVSHCLFQFHLVAACLSLSPVVAACLSQCHGVAACLSCLLWLLGFLSISFRSHGVATGLSLSLPVPCSCCMFLILSYVVWPSLTVSQVPWSCYMSFTVSYGCWLPLQLSPSAMELLYVSHCVIRLLAVSPGAM